MWFGGFLRGCVHVCVCIRDLDLLLNHLLTFDCQELNCQEWVCFSCIIQTVLPSAGGAVRKNYMCEWIVFFSQPDISLQYMLLWKPSEDPWCHTSKVYGSLSFSIHLQAQHLYFEWILWHPAVDFSVGGGRGGGGFVVTVLFTILLFLNTVTGWGKENLKLHFHWQPQEFL